MPVQLAERLDGRKQEYTANYNDEAGSDTTLLREDQDSEYAMSEANRSRSRTKVIRLLYAIIVIQLVMILGFTFTTTRKVYSLQNDEQSEMPKVIMPGGEIYGLVPEFETEFKMVQNQMDVYTTDFTSEAQSLQIRQRWSDLMPKGNGVVHVNTTSDQKNLQLPFQTTASNGTGVYLLSWVHQLHCLYALMDAYDAVVQFGPDGSEREVLEGHKQIHSSHCFDYLRQTILCNMDSALEGTHKEGGTGTDGWDAYHTCRNYDQVKAWTESLRMSDDQYILAPEDSRIGNGGKYQQPNSGHDH